MCGKSHYLVFQTGAVSRAGAFYVTVIHGRVRDVFTYYLVCCFIRMGYKALRIKIVGSAWRGKPLVWFVCRLGLAYGKVYAVAI